MKTSTVVIIGVAALGLVYVATRSSSALLKKPTTGQPTTSNVLSFLGGAGLGLAGASLLGGGSSSSGSSSVYSTSSGSSYAPDTATSNYLADTTAASDDATGVVGFGGWGD